MFQLITKKFGHHMGTFNFREEAEAKAAEQWHTQLDIIEFTPKYANECLYTDVNPFEIVKKISDLTYEIRQMKCEPDPSFKPEELPAVTLPSFLKAGFNLDKLSIVV